MTTNANANRTARKDEVALDGVIKELVCMEEKTSKAWDSKWGFMKHVDEICIEIAANLGISEKEWRRMVRKEKSVKPSDSDELERKCKPSGPVPITSSGFVGWRAKIPNSSLEKYGPLYISPRHTIDPPDVEKLPVTQIILG